MEGTGIGSSSQPQRAVTLSPETTSEATEELMMTRDSGFLPKSFFTCYTTYREYFDVLKKELDSVGESEIPAGLRADIAPPVLHCILARRHVLETGNKHGIQSDKFKPFSNEREPLLPALDFSAPQLKHQRLASEIIKQAEFNSLRSAARAARKLDVVAKLDDCASFGAGAFLQAIPLGRGPMGNFVMQSDRWRIAARAHLGLPAPGIHPQSLCGMCGEKWSVGVRAGGCLHARAAVHPSVCNKGQFKSRRHDRAVDVLGAMYKAVGGTYAADHDKQMNTANTNTVGSVCTLASGNRVDLILYGAGPNSKDVAVDVSFVCAESYLDIGFAGAIKKREDDKDRLYKAECEDADMLFYPFVLGAHGGFGKKAKELWDLLVRNSQKVQGRDWRQSWTAMSYSAVWKQKLSIVLANETAVGHQRRMPLVTRQRVLGEAVDQSGDGEYESLGEGRVDERA